MKVLVVGSGGREHALCWRLDHDGHQVWCAPGNAGTVNVVEEVPVSPTDLDAVVAAATRLSVDLVVVGPEAPLVAGLADALRDNQIATFGPGRSGARLEGSKTFSKQFFARHGIPSGDFATCTTMGEVEAALSRLGNQVVVKADGLAAGKGVVVCSEREQALASAREMLEQGRFGEASRTLVVEERLFGRELSVMAITDGNDYRILATAEDHKAVYDGDLGPNTGGMGAVSPASWVTEELVSRMRAEVFEPTLRGLRAENIDFCGVLYAGVMVGSDGSPKMLEYNVRFGDPETQAVLPRVVGDFGAVLKAAATGGLANAQLEWSDDTTCAVVMASEGYPATPVTGRVITGLDSVDGLVFHAGTKRSGEDIVTAGGRVLAVVARGDTLDSARRGAYQAADAIAFEGHHYRRDIGAREGS